LVQVPVPPQSVRMGSASALSQPRLAITSPKLAGYGAFGVGAAGRLGANAVDKLGPFGTLPYGNLARGTRQIGRIDSNPFSAPAQP
jgi:hypothetical protein